MKRVEPSWCARHFLWKEMNGKKIEKRIMKSKYWKAEWGEVWLLEMILKYAKQIQWLLEKEIETDVEGL